MFVSVQPVSLTYLFFGHFWPLRLQVNWQVRCLRLALASHLPVVIDSRFIVVSVSFFVYCCVFPSIRSLVVPRPFCGCTIVSAERTRNDHGRNFLVPPTFRRRMRATMVWPQMNSTTGSASIVSMEAGPVIEFIFDIFL